MKGAGVLGELSVRIGALAEDLGRIGVVGIGLLMFALTWYASAVVPAAEEVGLLQSRLERAERGGPRELPPAQRAAAQLQDFQRFFPEVSEAPRWVLKLHSLAEAEGLTLETGEYRMIRDAELGMSRYQVTLPLKGGYPQVRRFIARVLDEVPAAGIDEVAMKRDAVGASGIETRVRFTLYFGDRS